jgi:hypothetical protein
VCFPRIRTPQENQVRLLDFAVRTGAAARSKDCRQTDDTWGVSSPVAAIDVVTTDHRANELLRNVIQLVGRLRATEHAEGSRAVFLNFRSKALGHTIQRLIPGCGAV